MPRLAAAALPLLAAAVAAAQERTVGRRTVDHQHSWFAWFGENPVSPRVSLWSDVQFRREGLGATWQQLLLRPGVTAQVAPGVRVGGGYAYIVTWPYGELPAPARFPEHRLWEQVQLAHQAGPLAVLHRYRLEHRWIGVMDTSGRATGAGDVVARWRNEQRFRYLVRATHPLGRTRGAYLTAFDEVFLTAGGNERRNLLDQNRAFAGIGWRFSSAWRAEAGYLEQRIWRGDGVGAERNHTLSVAVISAAPVPRTRSSTTAR